MQKPKKKNKVYHLNQLEELDTMYIYITFAHKTTPLHLII